MELWRNTLYLYKYTYAHTHACVCEHVERVYEYEGTATAHMPITFHLQPGVNPELLKGTQLITQAWKLLILPSSKLSAVLWAAWPCPFYAQQFSLDGLISGVIRSQGFLGLKTNLGTRFAQVVQTQELSPLQGLSLLALQAHFFFLIIPLRRLRLWRILDWRARNKKSASLCDCV